MPAKYKGGRAAAQARYNSKPEQKKRRAARNKARRIMERKGKVRKGDGKDVDHKNMNPHDNRIFNLDVKLAGENRSHSKSGAKKKRKK